MCDNARECAAALTQGFDGPPAPAGGDVGRRSIRPLRDDEFEEALSIINEAAEIYRGVIPDDRWHEPYMSAEYLRTEIDSGVLFFGYAMFAAVDWLYSMIPVRHPELKIDATAAA